MWQNEFKIFTVLKIIGTIISDAYVGFLNYLVIQQRKNILPFY